MMIRDMLIVVAAIAFVGIASAHAHEVEIDTHAQLVPIPSYSRAYGQASAGASLRAARRFLESFDGSMRAKMMFGLNDSARANWSNLPAGLVERDGLSVGDMSDAQRALLFEFLSASLSPQGYENVMGIMAAEAFLSTDSRAQRLQWAPENYWISFYGTPSATAEWGWQYGGHHLGLNIAVKNGAVESLSPSFVGTEPASFSYKGVDYVVVLDMHQAGYDVFLALDEAQQRAAAVARVPREVAAGPGEDGTIPSPIGMRVSDMTASQKALLVKAIEKWVLIQPEENSARRMAEIRRGLDETRFAWTGVADVNTPSYMRIQGPTLLIELLSTGGNVGPTAAGLGHYHTIYRDPTNEYGRR